MTDLYQEHLAGVFKIECFFEMRRETNTYKSFLLIYISLKHLLIENLDLCLGQRFTFIEVNDYILSLHNYLFEKLEEELKQNSFFNDAPEL